MMNIAKKNQFSKRKKEMFQRVVPYMAAQT